MECIPEHIFNACARSPFTILMSCHAHKLLNIKQQMTTLISIYNRIRHSVFAKCAGFILSIFHYYTYFINGKKEVYLLTRMLEEAVILKAKKQEYLEKKRQDLVGKSKTIKKQKQDEFITAERIVKDARRKRMSFKKSTRNVPHSHRCTSHTKSSQTAYCL